MVDEWIVTIDDWLIVKIYGSLIIKKNVGLHARFIGGVSPPGEEADFLKYLPPCLVVQG